MRGFVKKAVDFSLRLSLWLPSPWLFFFLPNRFIIYGHLVSDRRDCIAARRYRYPTFSEFDEFKSVILKKGYRFVTMQEYLASEYEKMVLVSFDDGFKEVLDFHGTGVPFTIFILSAPLDAPDFAMDVFPGGAVANSFLAEPDVLRLKSNGVFVGFHTQNHSKVDMKELEEHVDALTIPARYSHLFDYPRCFAYPFMAPKGYKALDERLKRMGYEYFFDTRGKFSGEGPHFFRIPMDVPWSLRVDNGILANLKMAVAAHILNNLRKWLWPFSR